MIKAIIFDMDGTILNTLDDLADAVNYALSIRNHKGDYNINIIRMLFGSGIKVAFERALAIENGCKIKELEQIGTDTYCGKYRADSDKNEEIEKLIEVYLPYYNAHCNDKTRAYDGINELLDELREKGIKTAVVSNKPDGAVKILCQNLFDGKFDYCLGEKPDVNRKPARDMIDMSLKALGVTAEEACYVGDSEIDLQTGRNSDLPCIAVSWGFRDRQFLEEHSAKVIVDAPSDILKYIL